MTRTGWRAASARAAPLLAAGVALGAVALTVAALVGGGTDLGTPFVLSPPGVIDANNSPAIARNPADPANLVVAHRVDRPGFDAVVNVSFDGGRSWAARTPPLPAGLDRPFAPDVAFDGAGILYLLYSNLTGPGNVPQHLWLATSADGGRTFGEPVEVAGELAFQPRLAVGPEPGRVHVTWLQGEAVGLLRFDDPLPRIVAAASADGGATFGEPVELSDPGRPLVGAAAPIVLADGTLVALYVDFADDERDFRNLAGPRYRGTFTLVAARSTDVGFEDAAEVDDRLEPTHRFLVFLPEFPSLAAAPDGTLHAAWADGRNGDRDVFHARSADRGATWSEPVRVNDNRPDDGTSQYLPAIDVGPDGRIEVLYLDRRDDPSDVLTAATLATSTDGGASFTNHTLTDLLFDSSLGPQAAANLEPDFGTRLAVLAGPDQTFAAWADTSLATSATGRQVVAGAFVARDGGGSRGLLLALAGGLLGLGAALLWWGRRAAS